MSIGLIVGVVIGLLLWQVIKAVVFWVSHRHKTPPPDPRDPGQAELRGQRSVG